MYIDTHCHLDAAEFGGNQAGVVERANAAGVDCLIVPSVDRNDFAIVRELCERFSGCAPAWGIHPMYVDDAVPDDLQLLRSELAQGDAVAVGEIGLDFFVEHDRERQEFYFSEQLKLAREFDLPVLLHIRRAQDTILKHLRRIRVRGGIAHAFNGSTQQAQEFIKLGFKLGFGGAMTYTRASRLRQLATTLPVSSLVLETDAPDMPPAWLERGQPNTPEQLPRIAQTLADLRGITVAEVVQATTENALEAVPGLRLRRPPP